MAQITWRNIDAPDLTRALAGIAATNTGMQEALGGARTALQDFQTDRERVVSNELLAGALGASDEAGLNAFMQGDRAAQMLQSGLVTPEALAAVSQQRGNLLNNSLARTNLGVLEQDIANQADMVAGLMALSSGRGLADLTDEQRAALALHSQGGTQAANILFNNRQHNQRDDHFRLTHDLQKQHIRNQANYQNARLLQNALGGVGGGVSESGFTRRDKNGKLYASDAVIGAVTTLSLQYANDPQAFSSEVARLVDAAPVEERGVILEAANNAYKDSKFVSDAIPTSHPENISLADATNLATLKSTLEKAVGPLDPEKLSLAQEFLSNWKSNLGEKSKDVSIPIPNLVRAINTPVPGSNFLDSPLTATVKGTQKFSDWLGAQFGIINIPQYTNQGGDYDQLGNDHFARHLQGILEPFINSANGPVPLSREEIDFRKLNIGK